MWIENVSFKDVENGFHHDAGSNSMMINIVDPDMEFPIAKHNFKEVHRFKFLDIEEDGLTNNDDGTWTDMSKLAITQDQADEIVRLLKHALHKRMNVIVSCFAGVCRSGAVAQFGVELGFNDVENFRSPNTLVLDKLHRALRRDV